MTDMADTPESAQLPEAKPFARWSKLDSLWLFLLAVSGFATWSGIWELMSADSKTIAFHELLFSLIVVVVLTGGLGMSADHLIGSKRHLVSGKAKILLAACAAMILMVSVGLAYAFWWDTLAAQSTTDAEVEADIARIDSELRQTKATLGATANHMALLAKSAAERAVTEGTEGGTCGIASAGKVGAMARLRETHARFFADVGGTVGMHLQSIDGAVIKADQAIGNMRKASKESDNAARSTSLATLRRELDGVSQQVAALRGDAVVRSQGAEMAPLAKAYRTNAGHEGGITCIDQGIASTLDGARQSLLAVKPISAATFQDYHGKRATLEAVRRFAATTIGWLPWFDLGKGISGFDEIIAYILAWVVDGSLILATALRRGSDERLVGEQLLHRARRQVADSEAKYAADALLTSHAAMSHAEAMRALSAWPDMPFAELIRDYQGMRYLIIPRFAGTSEKTAIAQKMLELVETLACDSKSGVTERLRLSKGRFFGLKNYDRRARSLLATSDKSTQIWGHGRDYKWFLITPSGLKRLSHWVQASQSAACLRAHDGDIQQETQYSARESLARAAMRREAAAHRARLAEAELEALIVTNAREIDASRQRPHDFGDHESVFKNFHPTS